jgi:hypothetical protein
MFCLVTLSFMTGCESETKVSQKTALELSDAEIGNIVRRSYQYVAMYNVISKTAMVYAGLTESSGWNIAVADTQLKDHNYKAIARPNNDTLYGGSMLDLREEPIIVEYPAFDSTYVSLETSAYDHYVDIPLSTTKGDFQKGTKILYYTARTKGYSGSPVKGVDKIMEMTGDFAVAFLRVMPHAAEPERMKRNLAAMNQVKLQRLSEYMGEQGKPTEAIYFPAVGSDFEVFENNFLEVMQFVFNHTTFDRDDEMDQAVLAALKPLGVEPGKTYDPDAVARIDGKKFSDTAKRIAEEAIAIWASPEGNPYVNDVFKPKGEMKLDAMVVQSAYGPIGLPSHQAVYPGLSTTDGKAMNAQQDYVIRMTKDEMPPAKAFWSVTLYDSQNGFFIPNDHMKYSVGENAGFKLDKDGGIEIHIAAQRPNDVPAENWLPINRKDEALDIIMRIYAPDLEKMKTWTAPKAEKL